MDALVGQETRTASASMRIVWSSRALRDLIEIREYVALDKPRAAEKLAKKIASSAERLTQHPHLGRRGREPEARELLIAGTPYILAYKFQTDRLAILTVLHGARKPT